jgi:hypothetical protein
MRPTKENVMNENVYRQLWNSYPPEQKKMVALGCLSSLAMIASPPLYMLTMGVSAYRWNRLFKHIQEKGINWEEPE